MFRRDPARESTALRRLRWSIVILVCSALPGASAAAQPTDPRLEGYVGEPYKVIAGDFTGDGLVDLVLGYRNVGVVSVEHGDGAGGISKTTLNSFPDIDGLDDSDDSAWSEPHVHNLAAGDIDQDGLPDLAIAVGGLTVVKRGRIVVARNAGQGRFESRQTYPTPGQAKGVRLADMDNDGELDLLYTVRGSGYEGDLTVGRLYVGRGLGNWEFGPAIESDAGKSAYYVETADLNHDGFLDVIVPNEHDTCVTYFLNPGRALFTADEPQLTARVVHAAPIPGRRSHAVNDVRAADVNGDGHQDLITANLGTSTVSIFAGNGDGTFREDVQLDGGKNGAFLATGDFDKDGDIDFVITHWTEDFASVFLNIGDGRFSPRADYKTGLGNYGVAVADLDADGHADIATANYREHSMSVLGGMGDGTFATATTSPKGLKLVQGKRVREQ